MTTPIVQGPFLDIATAPRPFVFVLMPFKPEFGDIYKLGIKAAAEAAGAYAERVDEQHHTESILERIVNQISKADVLVADMTGRNPNVYYEVGYAHALDKQVVLVTQDIDDIPFDLRHRPHIAYSRNNISNLKTLLEARLQYLLAEGKSVRSLRTRCPIEVRANGVTIPEAGTSLPPAVDVRHMSPADNPIGFGVAIVVSMCNVREASGFECDGSYFLLRDDCPAGGFVPNGPPSSPDWLHRASDADDLFTKRFTFQTFIRLSYLESFTAKLALSVPTSGILFPMRLELCSRGRVYRFDFMANLLS